VPAVPLKYPCFSKYTVNVLLVLLSKQSLHNTDSVNCNYQAEKRVLLNKYSENWIITLSRVETAILNTHSSSSPVNFFFPNMADCGKCLKSLKNVKGKVDCCGCSKAFHFKCVNMSADDVAYLAELGQVWRCEPCAIERRRSMVLETATNVNYNDVLKLVQELKSEFKHVEKSLGESLNSCHEELITANEKLLAQTNEIASLKGALEKMVSENTSLRNTISKLETRIDDLEQYSRRNNFEIHGVPQNPNENVLNIVKSVGDAIGVKIEESMIDACHRLKTNQGSGRAPGIIVKMVRRIDTETILQKRRVKKDLSTRHLGLAVDSPVYINESLSPARRRLLAATREARKTKGYKYVWVRGGKIFCRKGDGDEVIHVKSMEDLARL
jgi:regulator of replication initiation timing